MTTPNEGAPADPLGYGARPPPVDREHAPASPFQEINERRARVENAELLRNLRSL
jgi:hypothetical protein